jgi:Hsp70 protein
MGWTLGVDFGTSNTAAAWRMDGANAQPVRLTDQSEQMPSAVLALDTGVMVGGSAVRSARLDPQRFEPSPKRRLGEQEILLGSSEWRVVDLVAEVLSAVRQKAMWVAGGSLPDQVVLTYPQQWAQGRIGLLASAASKAGFPAPSVRMITEPIAAATWYAATQPVPPGKCVAVFDFGGGTCDVAVLRSDPGGTFTVLAADGLDPLGGETIDLRLLDWTLAELTAGGNRALAEALSAPENLGALLTLKEQVKHAKHDLAEYESARIPVAVGSLQTVITITSSAFDSVVGADIDSAVALTRRSLNQSGVLPADLHALYLTGGSSHLRLVHRKLTELLGRPPATFNDPKLVVAQGSLLVPAGSLLVPSQLPPAASAYSGAGASSFGPPSGGMPGPTSGAFAGPSSGSFAGTSSGSFAGPASGSISGSSSGAFGGPHSGSIAAPPPMGYPAAVGGFTPGMTLPGLMGSPGPVAPAGGSAGPSSGAVPLPPTGPIAGPPPPPQQAWSQSHGGYSGGRGGPSDSGGYQGPPTGGAPSQGYESQPTFGPPSQGFESPPPFGPPSQQWSQPSTGQQPFGGMPPQGPPPSYGGGSGGSPFPPPKKSMPKWVVPAAAAAVVAAVAVVLVVVLTGNKEEAGNNNTGGTTTSSSTRPTSTSPSSSTSTQNTAGAITCWDGTRKSGTKCTSITGQAGLEWVFPQSDTWTRTCDPFDEAIPGEREVYLCTVEELPGTTIYLSRWSSSTAAIKSFTDTYGDPEDWLLRDIDDPVGKKWNTSAENDQGEPVGVRVRIYDDSPYTLAAYFDDPEGAGAAAIAEWDEEQLYRTAESIATEGSVPTN